MDGAYTFINLIQYSAIQNWSVQYMLQKDYGYSDQYPLARIGSFLKKSKIVIDVADEESYMRVTVRTNNGGVCLRDIKKGKDIGTKKQNVVRKGQYIVSKIDARNGAFGIIPDELDGAIVTNDFPVFDVDNSIINTMFLLLVTTTKPFVSFAQSCSSGTTNRRRIDIEKFLEQEIPLPSLEEQETLLHLYNKYISQALSMKEEIQLIEEKIDAYILKKLSVRFSSMSFEQIDTCKFLKCIHSKDIQRWDCYNVRLYPESTLYTNVRLADIITAPPMYGAAYKASAKRSEIRYIRITDINEDGSLTPDAVSAIGYSDAYLLKQNDFLIARSGNTVGKTFLYDSSLGKAIFAGYLIRFELDDKTIIPQYLLYYTKSSLYKQWINSNKRVSAQPNINSQQYLASPIILPPLETQEIIVKYVRQQRDEIDLLKMRAIECEGKALQEFEKTLFKNKDEAIH